MREAGAAWSGKCRARRAQNGSIHALWPCPSFSHPSCSCLHSLLAPHSQHQQHSQHTQPCALLFPSSREDPSGAAVTATELRSARDPDFSVPPKLQCPGMKLTSSFLLFYLNFNDVVKVAKLHCLTGPKAVRAF